jgi:hypothetical protein
MKSELEKYDAVNSCETLEELANVIRDMGVDGMIQGRTKVFKAEEMALYCENFDLELHNLLTREYGIRQQAMYILFYKNLG